MNSNSIQPGKLEERDKLTKGETRTKRKQKSCRDRILRNLKNDTESHEMKS